MVGSAESSCDELSVVLNYIPALRRGSALSLWKNTERNIKTKGGEGKRKRTHIFISVIIGTIKL